jgi:hypothetical protein
MAREHYKKIPSLGKRWVRKKECNIISTYHEKIKEQCP